MVKCVSNEEYIEQLVDALDHIKAVANNSRTQTRRLRWISERARCAVEGGEDWKNLVIPPSVENLVAEKIKLKDKVKELEAKIASLINSEGVVL